MIQLYHLKNLIDIVADIQVTIHTKYDGVLTYSGASKDVFGNIEQESDYIRAFVCGIWHTKDFIDIEAEYGIR